jgi:shikimate dehydrogenase
MLITGNARLAGVMAWPVGHSLSPRLHNHWLSTMDIDGAYVPLPVRPEDVDQAIAMAGRMGFRGLNVTVPHKEAALKAVDTTDDLATRIGAVNTIIYDEDGRSHGTNTDGFGFIENIRQKYAGWDFTDGPAVVLGAGGAARAIVVALMDEGVPEILICNRTTERADRLVRELTGPLKSVSWDDRDGALADASLLVNTTTLGMTGKDQLEISLDALPEYACVTDIVYAPLETRLLRAAYHRGNPTVDGIGMLLHQARPGFEAWFGAAPQVDNVLRLHVLAGTDL